MLSDSEWAQLGRTMTLTHRETQVLRLVFAEAKNEVIAKALGISIGTVRTLLERVYRKCGCRSRTGAVVSAFRTYVEKMKR
jgi:DNA-binding CsgD family transcriptional regulator